MEAPGGQFRGPALLPSGGQSQGTNATYAHLTSHSQGTNAWGELAHGPGSSSYLGGVSWGAEGAGGGRLGRFQLDRPVCWTDCLLSAGQC